MQGLNEYLTMGILSYLPYNTPAVRISRKFAFAELERKEKLLLDIRGANLPVFSFLAEREIAPMNSESLLSGQLKVLNDLFKEIHNTVKYHINGNRYRSLLESYDNLNIDLYNKFNKRSLENQDNALLILAQVLLAKGLDIPTEDPLKVREWINNPDNSEALEGILEINLSEGECLVRCIPREITLLRNLQKITIENCNLVGIPPYLCSLVHLKKISLPGNFIESVPEEISMLTKLEEFDLSRNWFSKFPEELFRATSLTDLEFHGNQIEDIPAEIKKLKNLAYLGLSNNYLKEFPKELYDVPSLYQLDLHKNKIKNIPDGIKNLISLAHLTLYDNEIIILPEEIRELGNLETLDVRYNRKLSSLPPNLNDKAGLTILTEGTQIDGTYKKRARVGSEDSEGGGGGGSK